MDPVELVLPLDLSCAKCGGTTAELRLTVYPDTLLAGDKPKMAFVLACPKASCQQTVLYGDIPVEVKVP